MTDPSRKVPVYTISVATRLTGLTARQIRYCEAFIKANRAEGLNLYGIRALLQTTVAEGLGVG